MISREFPKNINDIELGLIDIIMLFGSRAEARKVEAEIGPIRMYGLVGQVSRMALESTAIDYLKKEKIQFTVIDSFGLRISKKGAPFYPGVPWLWGWVDASGCAWVRHKPKFFQPGP